MFVYVLQSYRYTSLAQLYIKKQQPSLQNTCTDERIGKKLTAAKYHRLYSILNFIYIYIYICVCVCVCVCVFTCMRGWVWEKGRVIMSWNQTTDLRKGKVIVHNFMCCIHRNSQMFRNFICSNPSVNWISTLGESTMSNVLAIVGLSGLSSAWIPTFIKQFSTFVNFFFFSFFLFSTYIGNYSVNFTWIVLLRHQHFDGRSLFKPEALCLICRYFE